MRKIVQLQVVPVLTPVPGARNAPPCHQIYALDEHGQIWVTRFEWQTDKLDTEGVNSGDQEWGTWDRFPPLPSESEYELSDVEAAAEMTTGRRD